MGMTVTTALLEKARRARSLLAKFEGFSGDDADIAATILASFSHLIGAGSFSETRDRELTDEERAEIAAAVKFQQEQGLALLSESARERIGAVLDQLNEYLVRFASGEMSAIEAGRELAALLADSWEGGPLSGLYSEYEFSRLARTEAAFQYNATELAMLREEGVSEAILEQFGVNIPIHPNCLCAYSTIAGTDGKEYVVIDAGPVACEICEAVSYDMFSAVP